MIQQFPVRLELEPAGCPLAVNGLRWEMIVSVDWKSNRLRNLENCIVVLAQ